MEKRKRRVYIWSPGFGPEAEKFEKRQGNRILKRILRTFLAKAAPTNLGHTTEDRTAGTIRGDVAAVSGQEAASVCGVKNYTLLLLFNRENSVS